ncbi:transmembrane protease serine 9-like [Condylostylus longicornis]|uniref:transmembrane protease serine 9-like n=1 Tax=Condylostylus longicornis TaxID=2530218 RepID=UPI00244E0860|nr:transmembrane protease serine 9-like [Condylostylus longicornis]
MLLYGGEFICGGSLINDRYILTAAHCVHKFSKYGISVRLLTHNRNNPGEHAIDINAEEIFAHASYYSNNDTYINDIALIKLESKVDFNNKKLKPICLPCGTLNLVNEKGLVIGWGRTSEDGEVAENLLQVSLPILSNTECESKIVPVVSDMLCAGEEAGGKDACQVLLKNSFYKRVVSYGDGCARPNLPGIYSKVTSYYRWIRDHTKDACYFFRCRKKEKPEYSEITSNSFKFYLFGFVILQFATADKSDEKVLTVETTTFPDNNLDIQTTTVAENEQIILLNETDATVKQNPFLDWIVALLPGLRPPPPVATPQPVAVNKTCGPCECGHTNKRTRIVGGKETLENQYPWMAMMLYHGKFYCGATLITDRNLLTAAHCVNGFNKDYIVVRMLEHNKAMTSAQRLDRKVRRVLQHSLYTSSTYNNDIAILYIDHPVQMNKVLRPACLPTPGKSFTGETGIVTGWGATMENGVISDVLQEVSVPIMSNTECRRTKYGALRITDNMLCAGFKEGLKDSCQGDSGGPLHVISDGSHQIAGIVSWGEGCAQPNQPGVYTRVNRYGTWIRSNTQDACYC